MANSKKGYIRLDRQILENKYWQSNEPFDMRSAWIDLLLTVNHSRKEIIVNSQNIIIERGQMFTSIEKLAKRWKWSKNRVCRTLKLWEFDQMITRCRTHSGTLLTLVKYGFYQDARYTNGYADGDADGDADEDKRGYADGSQTINDKRMNIKNDKRMKKGSPAVPISSGEKIYEE